jgi:hypothetical protein
LFVQTKYVFFSLKKNILIIGKKKDSTVEFKIDETTIQIEMLYPHPPFEIFKQDFSQAPLKKKSLNLKLPFAVEASAISREDIQHYTLMKMK